MTERKNTGIIMGFVLAVSLITASFTALVLNYYDSRAHFQIIGGICQEIVNKEPAAKQAVLDALKEYKQNPSELTEENIIQEYGYRQADLWRAGENASRFFVVSGFVAGALLLLISLMIKQKKEISRIDELTGYLEKVNTGKGGILLQTGEDAFSRLQDEIYKTVTMLYHTREMAIDARNRFAENLANIAHQIKTPITAISLSVQMMKEQPEQWRGREYFEQIGGQLSRLTHLEEALLMLSRIDAGTLALEKKEVDVFTLLMLAADNLQELSNHAKVSVNVPEMGECTIVADLNWTMEAVINLMKNCIEHTSEEIFCDYEQNPLYTQIRIWDQGAGFAREDIPHLFERYYRGKNEEGNGIGIGLSLSKAIIECQNGTVRAWNLPEGGACFEVRFYAQGRVREFAACMDA